MYACVCEIVIVCVCVDVCVLEMCEVVSPCEATDYDRIAPRKGRSSLQQLTPLTKGRRFRSAFRFLTQEDHICTMNFGHKEGNMEIKMTPRPFLN